MITAERPMTYYKPVRTGEKLYFKFEADFVAKNLRCIPMIVRFKMDMAGIKLRLDEWSKFSKEVRQQLAEMPCSNGIEAIIYRRYLEYLVLTHTGHLATDLTINSDPSWANLYNVDELLQEKANEYNWHISIDQWQSLNNLQRFALIKLYRPGHENKNFPKAMKEFGLA